MPLLVSTATALMLILTDNLASSALAQGDAIKTTGWQPLCKLTQTLGKIPALAKGRLAHLRTAEQTARAAALKIHVYALTKADPSIVQAYQALARVLQETASDAANALQTETANAIDATYYASDMYGRAGGFLNFLNTAQTATTQTGYCLAGTGAAHPNGLFKPAQCGNSEPSLAVHTTDITSSEQTETGFADFSTGNHADNSGSGNSKCQLFNTGSSSASEVFQASEKVTILGGLVSITPNSASSTWHINDGQAVAAAGIAQETNLLTKTYNKVKALNNARYPIYKETELEAVKQAAQSPNLKNILAKIIKQENPETTSADNVAATLISKTFGDDGSLIDQLLKDLANTSVNGAKVAPTETVEIRMLNKSQDLQDVLDFYSRQRAKSIKKLTEEIQQEYKATKACKESPEDKEKVCNEAGDDQQKCKALEKEGCVFNQTGETNKKCKFDATKAEQQATQTATGAGTTTVKCSDHKDQATCEKANDGQPTNVCGWKGENSDGSDKGTYKCRDSSFLLNKQFALSVVSAAFVSLLF
uniref:Variant surface glycoprotein 1125.119 n=1 Tax=Trypanosoma brucei TaxID=5691 RepID=A0A1J0R568_9TRYP|nr:variant surface glycoprotein 1125.119 [Trypanosoma brucei]